MKIDMRINIDIRDIQEIRGRSNNVQAAWNVFLDWFTDGNRQQFGSRGQRWRTPWRELKPQTVAEKRNLGYTGDILVRDTTLMRSVTDRPMDLERVGPNDMEAGTRVDYARFHHLGAPKRNLPQRPLWNIEQIRDEGAATSAIRTWIMDGDARVEGGRRR